MQVDIVSVAQQAVRIAAKVTVVIFVLEVPTRDFRSRRLLARIDQVSIRQGTIDSSKREEPLYTQDHNLLLSASAIAPMFRQIIVEPMFAKGSF